MVKNRQPQHELAHSPSDNEEGSESEEQQGINAKSPPKPKKSSSSSKRIQTPSAPSSESGSDSDSPPPKIKPISSKTNTLPSSLVKSLVKRPLAEIESKDSSHKKAKKLKAQVVEQKKANDNDSKKVLFQRIWSEDDEIAILKGMIDYSEKKGVNPVVNIGAFHGFIKKSLHVEVTNAQLYDKIRRLKKKYKNRASKEKDGKKRTFSKTHEQNGYDLSKKIWGGNNNNLGNGLDDLQKEVLAMEVVEKVDLFRMSGYARGVGNPIVGEEIIKADLEFLEGSNRKEMEEKFKKLRVEDVFLYRKRMDLMLEQRKLVLEATKSSEK